MNDFKGYERYAGHNGFEHIASVPKGETITGIVSVNGVVYVSTESHIYKLVDDKRLDEVI